MKLDSILLIDDDPPTNFINERLIQSTGLNTAVHAFESGSEALAYINQSDNTQPSIIFLDINMPGMDGWEFLDQYEKLSGDKRSQIVLAMLSTSMNPDDITKANDRGSVERFISKPLRKEDIDTLVEKYFAA